MIRLVTPRLAALLLAFILLAPLPAGAYGPDVVVNGDFTTTLAGWTVQSGNGDLSWATADASGTPGSGSAKLEATPGQSITVAGSPCVTVQPGESLVVDGSAFLAQAGPTDLVGLGFALFSDAACAVSTGGSPWLADLDSAGWQALANGTTGSVVFSVRPQLFVEAGAAGSGVVAYFDQMRLRSGRCTPTPTTLCLNQGRFEVRASWQDFQGNVGVGRAVPFGSDSGSFWFFAASNLELDVKVLDACPLNQRFWVFAAGLTNVEVRLDVLDTTTRHSKSYFNPLGRTFTTVTDTDAFATCP